MEKGKVNLILEEDWAYEMFECAVPVVAEFFTTWCGPCKKMAPMLEQLAVDYPDIYVAKIDAGEADVVATDYSISIVPTFLLLDHGRVVAKAMGSMTYEQLVRTLGLKKE